MTSLNILQKVKNQLAEMANQDTSLQITLDKGEPLNMEEEGFVRIGLLIALQVINEHEVPIQ